MFCIVINSFRSPIIDPGFFYFLRFMHFSFADLWTGIFYKTDQIEEGLIRRKKFIQIVWLGHIGVDLFRKIQKSFDKPFTIRYNIFGSFNGCGKSQHLVQQRTAQKTQHFGYEVLFLCRKEVRYLYVIKNSLNRIGYIDDIHGWDPVNSFCPSCF